MAVGAVSASAFDPWAMLAKLRAGRPAPAAAAISRISSFSSFSRGEAADPESQAATDNVQFLTKLAARRRKAIEEGREFGTAPEVLAAMHAHGLDPGEDTERRGQRRMTSWADAALTPLARDWCSCCGKFERQGGRWWREATAPTGWRCSTCHPPPPGMAVFEVVT